MPRVSWWFVALGSLGAGLATLVSSDAGRSFAFDALGLIAAAGAVYGILRNRPDRRVSWLFLAFGLVLFAAGDVAWDVATRGAGASTGYPWADILYLAAYPLLAFALYRLARRHFRRDTVVDSAIVALGASAVIWQWVITPVIQNSEGATMERIVAAAYPVMDVVLVVAIVHAVFTLPRWVPAAWFLFSGLTVLLVVDTIYARLVADGTYTDGGVLDAFWPISYFLLAGAMLHPTMRELWLTQPRTASSGTHGHACSCSAPRCSRCRRWSCWTAKGRARSSRSPRSSASPPHSSPGASRGSFRRPIERVRCSPTARRGSARSSSTPPTWWA